MELFSRRTWRLASAQWSNKFGYCPLLSAFIILKFYNYNRKLLRKNWGFISFNKSVPWFTPFHITHAGCSEPRFGYFWKILVTNLLTKEPKYLACWLFWIVLTKWFFLAKFCKTHSFSIICSKIPMTSL